VNLLSKYDVGKIWGWVDVPAAISDWLAMQGYGGGHLPLAWWSDEDPDQPYFLLSGAGCGNHVISRERPTCKIEGGKVQSVDGVILCRMYSGSYHSFFSSHRHGHPTTVRTPAGRFQTSWIGVPAAEILPTGGCSHGVDIGQ